MPLGMSAHTIEDHQLFSSSSFDDSHQAYHARLLNPTYWRPSEEDTDPWLQVSFHERIVVSGLVLDGDWSIEHGWIWIEMFYLLHSSDGTNWKPYVYTTDNDQVRRPTYAAHKMQTNIFNFFNNSCEILKI